MFSNGNKSDQPRLSAARSAAFSLIELMLVVLLLGVLAAFAVPLFNVMGEEPSAEVLATNTRSVQTLIIQKMNGATYPDDVEAEWFMGHRMPTHTLAKGPMIVEVVYEAPNVIHPLDKTFEPAADGAFNAWYNVNSGAFRSRVPPQDTEFDTITLFNKVNKTSVLDIGEMTE